MQQQHTWSGSQFYPHFGLDSLLEPCTCAPEWLHWCDCLYLSWETFRGKPYHRLQPAGCSQHMSSLWSGFQIWPVLSNFEAEYMAFMSQLSSTFPIENGYKVVMIFPTPPNGSKIGLMTLTMPKAHLVPLFREANWGWCSSVQLAPAKSTCIQSIELEYKRVPFVLQVRISRLHVHVSSMCHPSMSFHVHGIPWLGLTFHHDVSSTQDRWTSRTHPRVHGIHLRAKWQFGEVPDSGARVTFSMVHLAAFKKQLGSRM